MPELPEVETVMRGLQSRLEGRRIVSAVAHRADLRWTLPPGLAQRLTGARVTGFRRRGKYILMRLDGGDSVLLHLGMSGRMVLTPRGSNSAPALPTPHEHLVLETDDGWRLGFVDPRRFGSVDLVPTAQEEQHRLLAELGPEPLDDGFTPRVLSAALAGKRTPIKAALLDQKVVAGLGNIYVCEALFRAQPVAPALGLHGARRAGGAAGAGDPRHAARGDRRRRVLAARLRAAGRRARLFPACLEGLWPRGRTLRTLPRQARPAPASAASRSPAAAHSIVRARSGRASKSLRTRSRKRLRHYERSPQP